MIAFFERQPATKNPSVNKLTEENKGQLFLQKFAIEGCPSTYASEQGRACVYARGWIKKHVSQLVFNG